MDRHENIFSSSSVFLRTRKILTSDQHQHHSLAPLSQSSAFISCLPSSEFFSCFLVNIVHTVLFLCCSSVRHILLCVLGESFLLLPLLEGVREPWYAECSTSFFQGLLNFLFLWRPYEFFSICSIELISKFTSYFVLWVHLFSLSLLSAASLCMAHYVPSKQPQPNHCQKPVLKKWCFSCLFSCSREVIEFV